MPPNLPPHAQPPVPGAPEKRPPIPGWLSATFAFGSIPVWMLVCGIVSVNQRGDFMPAAMGGAVAGLFCAIPLLGGLALASRFYSDTASRIVAGIGFAVALVVGLAAVLFAGCMCIVSLGNRH